MQDALICLRGMHLKIDGSWNKQDKLGRPGFHVWVVGSQTEVESPPKCNAWVRETWRTHEYIFHPIEPQWVEHGWLLRP
jgi:hypothetical protein